MTQIGRYQLQGLIGQGGMATVYRAYDPNFRREVAVKVLPANLLSQADLRARFQREAELVARIGHPSIVAVYDYGRADNGSVYYVMEFNALGSGNSLLVSRSCAANGAGVARRLAQATDGKRQHGRSCTGAVRQGRLATE